MSRRVDGALLCSWRPLLHCDAVFRWMCSEKVLDTGTYNGFPPDVKDKVSSRGGNRPVDQCAEQKKLGIFSFG